MPVVARRALILGLGSIGLTGCRKATPARVAAASDLQVVLGTILDEWRTRTGQAVDVVFGSSGLLARQIRDGAPFDLYLSADERYVEALARDGLTRDVGVIYAQGRLALVAPTDSPLDPAEGLPGLGRLFDAGRVPRFAIANPAHAPYGRAAEQALRHAGLWDRLRSALVLGENVSQAVQFATSGDAVGGLVSASLVEAPTLRGRIRSALIPAEAHAPLRQRMVRLARARQDVDALYAHLQSADVRAVFARHGLQAP